MPFMSLLTSKLFGFNFVITLYNVLHVISQLPNLCTGIRTIDMLAATH